MAKYWDWYEVEFDRVSKGLNPERRAEILQSLREHVDDAVRSIISEGKNELQAEQEAIRQLGPPSEVVRVERDHPRSGWLPVWTTWLGLAWCSAWAIVGWRELTPYMALMGAFVTPIAIFISTLVGKKTKLWAMGLACAVMTVVTVAGFSLTWRNLKYVGGIGYMPMLSYSHEMEMVQARIKVLDGDTAEVLALDEAFDKGVASGTARLSSNGAGIWRIRTGRNSTSNFYSFENAKKHWSRKAALDGIADERRELANIDAMVRDPRSFQPKESFLEGLPMMVTYGLAAYAVLAMFHIFGLACVRLPRAFRRARWWRALG